MKRKRKRNANMTAIEKWEICEMYRQRIKVKVIAAHYGRASSTIATVVKESGVPLRYKPAVRRNYDETDTPSNNY